MNKQINNIYRGTKDRLPFQACQPVPWWRQQLGNIATEIAEPELPKELPTCDEPKSRVVGEFEPVEVAPANKCDRCKSTEFRDIICHDGEWIRTDCARCGRTQGFRDNVVTTLAASIPGVVVASELEGVR